MTILSYVDKSKWLEAASYVATQTLRGDRVPVIDGIDYTPLWWTNKYPQIRIFWEPRISTKTIDLVIESIADLAFQIGHDFIPEFDFITLGSHDSAMQQIQNACVGGKLDNKRLANIVASEPYRNEANGGEQHGDVYITTREFVDDSASWGAAGFQHGILMLTLYGNRQQSRDFLKKVVIHEAGHFFGLPLHCDDSVVDEYGYDQNCVMHYQCPSSMLCPKCQDWIRQWWVQSRGVITGQV